MARFTPATHYEYTKNRFKDYPEVSLLVGNANILLPELTKKYDYIYIDADHSYEQVSNHLKHSLNLISKNGIIGFNDYIYGDSYGRKYGVIKAVCEFLSSHAEWEVIGFALQEEMYSDIYIKRVSDV